MPRPKPISKEMMLAAMAKTKSNKAAARYLGCSWMHFKRYAKLYVDEATGKTLFDIHKNQSGKGIPKFLKHGKKETALLDIIEGRVDCSHFKPEKIKQRLISEGFLEECCSLCKFCERRVHDYKMPLILYFKNNNKKNYRLDNLQLLCYNCYYIHVGDPFTDKQIQGLEDHVTVFKSDIDWELELTDYQKEMLEKLNLDFGAQQEEDGSEYISRS